MILPHAADGGLGHMTYLAKEMLVGVNVLLLDRSFKVSYKTHHLLVSLKP